MDGSFARGPVIQQRCAFQICGCMGPTEPGYVGIVLVIFRAQWGNLTGCFTFTSI